MKGIRVTEKEFINVKFMNDSGVPVKTIASLLKRDIETIKMMIRADDYASYLETRKAINTRKCKSNPENKKKDPDVCELLKIQNEKITEMIGYVRECARLLNGLNEYWK